MLDDEDDLEAELAKLELAENKRGKRDSVLKPQMQGPP